MSVIIDRRKNPSGKSLPNRQRFLRKVDAAAKKAIKEAIENKNIRDLGDGETVVIPSGDISEPTFGNNSTTGKREYVFPGNKEFVEGDKIPRPKSGEGQAGSKGSPDGEGEDEFAFVLSRDEFLDIFFEDLELPNLIRKNLTQSDSVKYERSGYTDSGSPANLDVIKSYQSSLGRRLALKRPTDEEIKSLEDEIAELEQSDPTSLLLLELREKLEKLVRKRKQIPYFDNIDMRYRNFAPKPVPVTAAVMFCIMDVSGSMTETKKDWAKRFFILLYLFLKKQYSKVDIVFIRHTEVAKEVNEEDFFHSKETGGTVVSTALIETMKIIKERYPASDWNIYIGQASDGDNWESDNPQTIAAMHELLPLTQYFAYVQIQPNNESAFNMFMGKGQYDEDNLWSVYSKIASGNPNLQCRFITDKAHIWNVFRGLFEKKATTKT